MNPAKDNIIRQLERIKSKPLFYVPKFRLASLEILLDGFRLGCIASIGDEEIHPQYLKHFRDIVSERSWEINTIHFNRQMKKKGLSDLQIFEEIMNIEIECWKRLEWDNW